jgi:hypothetical protein
MRLTIHKLPPGHGFMVTAREDDIIFDQLSSALQYIRTEMTKKPPKIEAPKAPALPDNQDR